MTEKSVVNSSSQRLLDISKPTENVGLLVGVLARTYRLAIERRMAKHGYPETEWMLLLNLWHREGATQQELADILQMTRGGMNKLLNRMEAAGYVRREEGLDQRSKRIYLQEKARPIIVEMDRVQDEVISASLAGVSETELQQLKGLLQRLQSNVERIA